MQNPTIQTGANPKKAYSNPPARAESPGVKPRYILNFAITMGGDNNFYRGLSHEIADEGIFIATYVQLPIGTPVVMSFTLARSTTPILVLGKVKWVRGPDVSARQENNYGRELADVKPGMGVQFEDVDSEAAAVIQCFMTCRAPEFFD